MIPSDEARVAVNVTKNLKRNFSLACDARGRSMTSVFKKFMEEYIAETRFKQNQIKGWIIERQEDFGTSASSSKANPVGSARSHQIY